MPDYLRALYGTFPLALQKLDGKPSCTLPLPARFVIARHGIIRAAESDLDCTTPVRVVAYGPESISGMYRLFPE